MAANFLLLNSDKTEVIVLGPENLRNMVSKQILTLDGITLGSSNTVRNLGVIFDQDMSFNAHIKQICKTAFFHLRNISKVRNILSQSDAEKLVHAFITSRLDYCNSLLSGCPKNSLKSLQLIQNAWEKANAETWRAFETAYEAGKAKAIGVSNFQIHHLESLAKTQKIAPMVNQNFLNPSDTQDELVAYDKAHDIVSEAYSPLGTGRLVDLPQVTTIAEKYHKSVPQVLIRWSLEKGFLPLPKSTHENYIKANLDVFDFALTNDEVSELDSLAGVGGTHTNADTANF